MHKRNNPNESSVKPYKEMPEKVAGDAQYGILSKLHGTWVNWKDGPTGLHTTPMPSPGTSSETVFGVFHFKSQEYREQLKFTQVKGPVRNRAGSNEQFNGAVKYETAIVDNDEVLQHFEDGMYLWLGDHDTESSKYQDPPTMYKHTSDEESVETDGAEPVMGAGELGPQFIPPYQISRSGVIPHGTTIHLTGNVKDFPEDKKTGKKENDNKKPPHIADLWEQQYLAVSPTMGINPEKDLEKGSRKKPDWTELSREDQEDGGLNSGRAYFQKIFNYDKFGAKFPFTVQPNLKLSDANENLEFRSYDMIELDSFHETGVQGGIINNVMIERYCKVVRMRYRMWIEKVYDKEWKKEVDQLQYEQIVDFEFMFGSNGGTTLWPHIQVNTLRRESEIPEEKLLKPIEISTEVHEKVDNVPSPAVCPMKHTRA